MNVFTFWFGRCIISLNSLRVSSIMRYNVYGVSDWPEELGKLFIIFENKEFDSVEDARLAARQAYDEHLDVIVKEVKDDLWI